MFEEFGTNHNMVSEFKLLNSLDDLEKIEMNYRGMYISLNDANISRENSNPVYDISIDIVIVDRILLNDPVALINSNQENLFVMGQLQDYFIQNLSGEQNFQEVNIQGFSDDDYNITASISNATFVLGRTPYIKAVDV
tara:strand:- start:135 stop:548 length:414 start_codon:yes stop_codon:yes gene_type:complete